MDEQVKQAIKEEFDIINDKLDHIMTGLMYQPDGSSMKMYKEINQRRDEIKWEVEEVVEG